MLFFHFFPQTMRLFTSCATRTRKTSKINLVSKLVSFSKTSTKPHDMVYKLTKFQGYVCVLHYKRVYNRRVSGMFLVKCTGLSLSHNVWTTNVPKCFRKEYNANLAKQYNCLYNYVNINRPKCIDSRLLLKRNSTRTRICLTILCHATVLACLFAYFTNNYY